MREDIFTVADTSLSGIKPGVIRGRAATALYAALSETCREGVLTTAEVLRAESLANYLGSWERPISIEKWARPLADLEGRNLGLIDDIGRMKETMMPFACELEGPTMCSGGDSTIARVLYKGRAVVGVGVCRQTNFHEEGRATLMAIAQAWMTLD